jgi:pheromone shutdown protein TraB
MITLIGTGHVFRIAEPVSFIVKHIWPDAVLIELDRSRYDAVSSQSGSKNEDASGVYGKLAEYQKSTAEEHGSKVGAEFIAAVEMGRTIGAAVEFIDTDARQTMEAVWKEMSFLERLRFRLSLFGDRFRSKKKAGDAVREFADNEEEYLAAMRKRYPTLVRKLIDERNMHMSEKIREASEKYGNIVVVTGDGHVEGIAKLLTGKSIRKIRLKTLMDTESMNVLRAELWSGRTEGQE